MMKLLARSSSNPPSTSPPPPRNCLETPFERDFVDGSGRNRAGRTEVLKHNILFAIVPVLRVQQVLQGQVRSASEKARRSVQLDLELDPVNIRRSTLDIEGKKELIFLGDKREIG